MKAELQRTENNGKEAGRQKRKGVIPETEFFGRQSKKGMVKDQENKVMQRTSALTEVHFRV